MSGEPEASQRRLVAILSMDAVGYSRLMAADETATVRTLTAYRDEIARLVTEAGGRVVDNPADNVLCEFPAATSALACALEIQRVLGELDAPLPSERRLVSASASTSARCWPRARASLAMACTSSRAAIVEARRAQPEMPLALFQRGIGVSRPEIDARRNAALRQAGLE